MTVTATRDDRTTLLPAAMSALLRRRGLQLLGIALIVLGLAALVMLATYWPTDPSFNRAADGPVRNLLGLPGAYAADLLLQTLGLGAGCLVVLFAGWGWRLLRDGGLEHCWLRILMLPFALILSATALAIFPPPEGWQLNSSMGGFVGTLMLGRITALMNMFAGVSAATVATVVGTSVVLLLLYLVAVPGAEWRQMVRAMAWLLGGFRAGRAAIVDVEADQSPPPKVAKRQRRAARAAAEPTPKPAKKRRAIVAPRRRKAKQGRRAERDRQPTLDLLPDEEYRLPPLDLLTLPARNAVAEKVDDEALAQNARYLESVLQDFGVKGEIVKVRPGPVITLYELEPAPGTKASRVVGLADDIARSMSAVSVRIAVIPGRNVIGIELPNRRREIVYLRELLSSETYEKTTAQLTLVLGKDIGGGPVIADLAKMPHLLIAGTTGSGKSVGINTMILSLLYRLPPDQCKFIMIDPKMLELSVYDGIPHLISPVVTEPKKAVVALKWVVREMESRYQAMSKLGVRNIQGYNARVADARTRGEVLMRKVQTGFDPDTGKPVFEEQPLPLDPLPYIVVVVDEMADLMLVAGKDIEAAVQRLAQMARAAGIHLLMATQRPSVDVITGTIKANFPTRISFQVTSKIDSRTILGEQGAEQLLGQGDMLHMAGGGRITRVHGPFVSDNEVEQAVAYLRSQGEPDYVEAITEEPDDPGLMGGGGDDGGDELYQQAVQIVLRERKASTSFIQRHLQIGYNRAARIVEQMEAAGVVSPANHVGKREILIGQDGV
jgi:S-DNA-T family DNA segregation ATPase FtsK/SpoIIIE